MEAPDSVSERSGIRRAVLAEIQELALKYGVDRVILFGSRARGDFRDRSDIDLAFSGGRAAEFALDVDETTSTLLKFDIIDLCRPVRRELLDSIEKEGITIYEKG